MAPAIDRLTKRVRRLERLARDSQDVAVDLAEDLRVIRRAVIADASGRLNAALEYALVRAEEERRRAARKAADVGAWKLETRPGRAGAEHVRIDEGKWFRLTRADARLLGILARVPTAADGFPGWIGYDEVGAAIEAKTSRAPTRHAMVEAIYRIRQGLKSVDHNEFLIRVDAKRGRVRFLLRGREGLAAAVG